MMVIFRFTLGTVLAGMILFLEEAVGSGKSTSERPRWGLALSGHDGPVRALLATGEQETEEDHGQHQDSGRRG